MTTTSRPALIGIILAAALCSCTETTQVRSYPAGSKVYVNDTFVGLTPLRYEVPSNEIGRDFHLRVEHPGYQSVEGMLKKDTCRGRIAGSVFTLGILLLFKSSTCFAPMHDFALTELSGADAPATSRAAPSVETRLQRLNRLHEQGTITDEELRRYRDAILQER